MRIALLPIALIAFFFAPWFTETLESKVANETVEVQLSAYDLLKPTIDCAMAGTYSVVGECAPKSGFKGYILLAVVVLGAAAILTHLVGFMGPIRKFGSSIALLAGLAGLGGAGWIGFDTFQDLGQEAINWGTYGTGGAALLTAIASFLGMRREESDA